MPGDKRPEAGRGSTESAESAESADGKQEIQQMAVIPNF